MQVIGIFITETIERLSIPKYQMIDPKTLMAEKNRTGFLRCEMNAWIEEKLSNAVEHAAKSG